MQKHLTLFEILAVGITKAARAVGPPRDLDFSCYHRWVLNNSQVAPVLLAMSRRTGTGFKRMSHLRALTGILSRFETIVLSRQLRYSDNCIILKKIL